MRPVLLGMNNPVSANPKYALYPAPVNCTGWRIWQMLETVTGISRSEYIRSFDRLNVINSCDWDARMARRVGPSLFRKLVGRDVIILGSAARRAVSVKLDDYLVWREQDGVRYSLMPHPSGKNLWYNDAVNRLNAAQFLGDTYYAYLHSIEGQVKQARVLEKPDPTPAG